MGARSTLLSDEMNRCRSHLEAQLRFDVRRAGTVALRPSAVQLRLCLFQPVAHVHLAVHRRSSHKVLSGFMTLARPSVELAEAEVTVGEERAHAKLVAKGHSL